MGLDVAGPDPSEPLAPCKLCGRKFAVSSLTRHEGVCRKMASKQRKVFDSGKQRATGSDIPIQSVKKVQQEIKQNKGHFKPPKTHWREKHEMFQSAVRAAKGVDFALKTGAPLPPPPKTKVPSDYVKCEFCGRNFAKAAADRHVPFCKEQKMRTGGISKQAKTTATPKTTVAKAAPKKTDNQQAFAEKLTANSNNLGKPSSALKTPSSSAGPVRTNSSIQNNRSASKERTPQNGPNKSSNLPKSSTSGIRKPSPARSSGIPRSSK